MSLNDWFLKKLSREKITLKAPSGFIDQAIEKCQHEIKDVMDSLAMVSNFNSEIEITGNRDCAPKVSIDLRENSFVDVRDRLLSSNPLLNFVPVSLPSYPDDFPRENEKTKSCGGCGYSHENYRCIYCGMVD